jgi:hypothetical protein
LGDSGASGREMRALGESIARRSRGGIRVGEGLWGTAGLPGEKCAYWGKASHGGHGGHGGGFGLGRVFGGQRGFRARNALEMGRHRTEGLRGGSALGRSAGRLKDCLRAKSKAGALCVPKRREGTVCLHGMIGAIDLREVNTKGSFWHERHRPKLQIKHRLSTRG